MVMNPLAMLNPKQQKLLQEVQQYTQDISAVVTIGDDGVKLVLKAKGSEAQKFVPQIYNATVESVAQTLDMMFNIKGKIEKVE